MSISDFIQTGLYYIGMAIAYFVGILMLYGALCLVLSIFWKGDVGKEMRKTCLVWLLVLLGPCAIIFVGNFIYNSCNSENNNFTPNSLYSSEATPSNMVYICTGSSSKKYHADNDCRWLGSCKGDIEEVSIDEAKELGRTPCKSCCK